MNKLKLDIYWEAFSENDQATPTSKHAIRWITKEQLEDIMNDYENLYNILDELYTDVFECLIDGGKAVYLFLNNKAIGAFCPEPVTDVINSL